VSPPRPRQSTPPVQAPKVVATPRLFTELTLRKGDNEKRSIYQGSIDQTIGGEPIRALQTALKAVGVYDGIIDGDYGGGTEAAVRRFQWNVHNLEYWYVSGSLQPNPPKPQIAVNGTSDPVTAAELQSWANACAETSGNLVRVPFADYAEFERGDGFKRIDNPSVGVDDIVIDADSTDLLDTLSTAAKDAGLTIYVNQVFRVSGVAVQGAVVKPATFSQHLIGNAVDCNIKEDGKFIAWATVASAKPPEKATTFLKAAKDAGLRWGGDFKVVDLVHFDDFIDFTTDAYLMRYYFNQRMIAKKHPLPAA
jgi:hypothetical protein